MKQNDKAECATLDTRAFHTFNDLMTPGPDHTRVFGEVLVGNPGVEVTLARIEPQGINTHILLLELRTRQKSGTWPQVTTWKFTRYDATLDDVLFSQVLILC